MIKVNWMIINGDRLFVEELTGLKASNLYP